MDSDRRALRLHSTYRHDLKIYSSDEGRVQITAAAFAKGLLALETHKGELTPILASLVTKDAKLLDFVTHEVEAEILHAKNKLYRMMTKGDPGDDDGNANTDANHGSIPSNDTAGDNTNVITSTRELVDRVQTELMKLLVRLLLDRRVTAKSPPRLTTSTKKTSTTEPMAYAN